MLKRKPETGDERLFVVLRSCVVYISISTRSNPY